MELSFDSPGAGWRYMCHVRNIERLATRASAKHDITGVCAGDKKEEGCRRTLPFFIRTSGNIFSPSLSLVGC
jgi:hypothetical protein